jgi:arginine repressor
MADLRELCQQLDSCEMEIIDQEVKLKELNDRYRELTEQRIPDVMRELGLVKFTDESGATLEMDTKVRTSISKKNKPAAFRWLVEHGHSGIIKNMISIALDRGEQDTADELVDKLRNDFENVRRDMKVEPMTLKKFVTDSLDAGREVPVDLFGIHVQTFTKVSRPEGAK